MTANIMFVSDDNYSHNLGVCSYSVLHNMCLTVDSVRVFVMDCGISEEHKEMLTRQTARFDNAEMIFFNIEKLLDEVVPKEGARWHRAIYGRLFIPQLMEKVPDIDRLLYLDCDIIMDAPVTELFTMDLEGKCLAAVADASDESRKKELGIPPEKVYINSGVLLIDAARWLALDASRRMIDYINGFPEELLYPDQDAINYVLMDDIKIIGITYNLMWMLTDRDIPKLVKNIPSLRYSQEEIADALHHGKIYHYAAHDMWSFDGVTPIHTRKFIKYRNLSDWKNKRRRFRSPAQFCMWLLFTVRRILSGDFFAK